MVRLVLFVGDFCLLAAGLGCVEGRVSAFLMRGDN